MTTAAQRLLVEVSRCPPGVVPENMIHDLVEESSRSYEELKDHINGVLPADLEMTAKEYSRYANVVDNIPNSDRKVYIGWLSGLYAAEDPLDQVLCRVGSALGYDIIILQCMVGSRQVVTEVLDTRDDSFHHLTFRR